MTQPSASIESDESEWTIASTLDDLWEGEMAGVRIDGRDILLVNLGSHGVHAYDNRCPHAGTRLSDGRLRLTTLQCSAHHWEFDVRTGGGVNPRNCSLQRFPTKVLDRLILVKLGDRTH